MWNYLNDKCESLHCSPERVAEYLAGTCSDGDVSALLSLLPTRVPYCSQGNGTECSPSSPYGTTCERSTASLGADTLTSSAGASPVRISALPGRVTDLTGNEADCGPRWPGSLARYNPGSRSWRTAQCSLLGGLTVYSATFPRWGTMQSGELWERTTPVLRIEGKGSGYWPTPKASMDGTSPKTIEMVRDGKAEMSLARIMYMPEKWPTNTPSGNWPTPTCSDAFTDKLKSAQQSEGSMHSVNLSQAVKMWPTPTAQESRYTGEYGSKGWEAGVAKRHFGNVVQEPNGGQLNPDWVEWLMGWPVGWTDLKPSATDRFRMWPHSHGIPSTPESSKEAEAA